MLAAPAVYTACIYWLMQGLNMFANTPLQDNS
jgi:hypothetical protein